jgi:hypothetical protein
VLRRVIEQLPKGDTCQGISPFSLSCVSVPRAHAARSFATRAIARLAAAAMLCGVILNSR